MATKTTAARKAPAKPAAKKAPRDWAHLIVKTVVYTFMIAAIVFSFSHIITACEKLGVATVQAWSAPFFIDGFVILGVVGSLPRFADSTRRKARWLRNGAVLVSLAANVYAGNTPGDRGFGALVVAAFLTAEWFALGMKAKAQEEAEKAAAARKVAAAEAAAKRKQAAVEAAARKAEQAEARRLARAVKETEDMTRVFDTTVAPVSPAPIGTAAAYI